VIYLKLDIEGEEFNVLDDLLKTKVYKYLNKLFVEWHDNKLKGKNYSVCKNRLIRQYDEVGLKIKEFQPGKRIQNKSLKRPKMIKEIRESLLKNFNSAIIVSTQTQEINAYAGMASSTSITAKLFSHIGFKTNVFTVISNEQIKKCFPKTIVELDSMVVKNPFAIDKTFVVKVFKLTFKELPKINYYCFNNDEFLNTPPKNPLRYYNLFLAEAISQFINSKDISTSELSSFGLNTGFDILVALNSPTAAILPYLRKERTGNFLLCYRNGSIMLPVVQPSLLQFSRMGENKLINVNEDAYSAADIVLTGPDGGDLYNNSPYDWKDTKTQFYQIRKQYLLKFAKKAVLSIHQPVSDLFSPLKSVALNGRGFVKLRKNAMQHFVEFKEKNKLALQQMLGLQLRKDAIIFTCINRIENWQKCSFAVLKTAEAILRRFPNAQVILVGNSSYVSDREVKKYLFLASELVRIYGSRVYFDTNQLPQEKIAKIFSGADYNIFYSAAEVYANALNEGCALGVIPLVSQTPGLVGVCKKLKCGKIVSNKIFPPTMYSKLSNTVYIEERAAGAELSRIARLEQGLITEVLSYITSTKLGNAKVSTKQQYLLSSNYWNKINIKTEGRALERFLLGLSKSLI
jgi:hypothetical protein